MHLARSHTAQLYVLNTTSAACNHAINYDMKLNLLNHVAQDFFQPIQTASTVPSSPLPSFPAPRCIAHLSLYPRQDQQAAHIPAAALPC